MSTFPSYYTFWHKLGYYGLRVVAGAVLLFLMAPILVIIPLSFNAEPYFTFTRDMIMLQPDAYSMRWYSEIIHNEKWLLAIKNSFYIGFVSAAIATILGTCAAVGLTHPKMPFKRAIMAILLSPMIVPVIITAAGMFFFYSKS